MAPTLGVVIPAYQPDVEELSEYIDDIVTELGPEVVRIELDSADDETVERLGETSAVVSTVPYRRGKGAAITAGFEELETDILGFVDADGATPASEFRRVLEPVEDGRCDLAVGSRRHPDSTVATHQTYARRRLGDTLAWSARRLLTVSLYDYQCGAKAITAEGWEVVRRHLYEPGFAWDIELVAMAGALELRVEEVPVTWYDRPGSTVSPFREPFRFARTLVRVRHRAKQLRDSRLHTAIADRRTHPETLVEQNESRDGR